MTMEPPGGSRDLYRVTVRAGTGLAATVLVELNQRRIVEFFSAMSMTPVCRTTATAGS